MHPATRTNQGGSILGYTIIAVVLALLVVGGIYTVHKLSYNTDNDSDIAVNTTENSEDKATSSHDSDGSGDTTKKSDSSDTSSQSKDNTSDDTTKSISTDSSSKDTTKEPKSESSKKKTALSTKDTHSEVDALPQTGPADSLSALAAVSVLSFAGVSYVQSRRTLRG